MESTELRGGMKEVSLTGGTLRRTLMTAPKALMDGKCSHRGSKFRIRICLQTLMQLFTVFTIAQGLLTSFRLLTSWWLSCCS